MRQSETGQNQLSQWKLQGFQSIFDCVIGSKIQTNQAGKALSGWTSRHDNKIFGGLPPELTSIGSSPELVSGFVLALFSEDTEEQ